MTKETEMIIDNNGGSRYTIKKRKTDKNGRNMASEM